MGVAHLLVVVVVVVVGGGGGVIIVGGVSVLIIVGVVIVGVALRVDATRGESVVVDPRTIDSYLSRRTDTPGGEYGKHVGGRVS